jgi:DNA polymerase alpha-associated DNA helicase A
MNTNDLDAVRRFCHAQLALIDSEQSLDAESSAAALQHYGKKELERRGQALTQCQVAGARTGFGGKTLVEIERAAGGKGAGVQQNAHSPMGQVMRTGDLIRIEQQLSGSATKKQLGDAAAHGVEGVVTKAQDDRLVVALTREEAEAPAQGLQVWCVKLANTVTYERMRKHVKTLLKQVEEGSSGPLALHRILLQNEAPSVLDAEVLVKEVHFYDAGLNGPQQQAVRHALAARELSIIHGPPGVCSSSSISFAHNRLARRALSSRLSVNAQRKAYVC